MQWQQIIKLFRSSYKIKFWTQKSSNTLLTEYVTNIQTKSMKPNLKRLMKVNTNTRSTTTSVITDNLISQNSVAQINKKIILEAGDIVATCPSLSSFSETVTQEKSGFLTTLQELQDEKIWKNSIHPHTDMGLSRELSLSILVVAI